ncbi:MAG: GNAT family N-acetyltransferase [Anaerolineales bacterium]|nr:GNAT family N-acetyltransferase [Anaerolineales bacterium]
MADFFQGKSKRIVLQAFEPEQISALHAHLNHPALAGRRYIPWEFPDDLPLSYQQVEAVYKTWADQKKGFNLALVLPEGKELIGHISCDWGWDTFCPQVSMVVYPDYQRRGYGGEVLQTVLDYLFHHTPAYNISGWIADWNRPALEFALKVGFTQCGKSRRVRFRNGIYTDSILVDLLREEWLTTQVESSHGA